MRRSSRRMRDVRSPSVFGRQQRPATGPRDGGGGLSLREPAVFEGGRGVLLGLVVVALPVEVRRPMVMVGGGMMMRRRVVVVLGRLMFRREGQSRGSLPECAVAGPPDTVGRPARGGWRGTPIGAFDTSGSAPARRDPAGAVVDGTDEEPRGRSHEEAASESTRDAAISDLEPRHTRVGTTSPGSTSSDRVESEAVATLLCRSTVTITALHDRRSQGLYPSSRISQ